MNQGFTAVVTTDKRMASEQPQSCGARDGLMAIRQRIQGRLRDVMARTERVGATDQGDSMVEEAAILATLTPSDVRQYLWADEVLGAVGDRDPMPYWKSAAYLPQFMHGYRFNERLATTLEEAPAEIEEVLRRHGKRLAGPAGSGELAGRRPRERQASSAGG